MRSIVAIGLFGLLLLMPPGVYLLFEILVAAFSTVDKLTPGTPAPTDTNTLFLCLLCSALLFPGGLYLINRKLNAPIRLLTENIHHSQATLSHTVNAFPDVKQLERAVKLHHRKFRIEYESNIANLKSSLRELQRSQRKHLTQKQQHLDERAEQLEEHAGYINSINQLLTPALQTLMSHPGHIRGDPERSARLTRSADTVVFLVDEMTNTQPDTAITMLSVLDLMDDIMEILAPLLQSSRSRVHILLDAACPTRVACNTTCLKQLLFMLMLSYVQNSLQNPSLNPSPNDEQERSVPVTVSYQDGLLSLRFIEDFGPAAALPFNARFNALLATGNAEWTNQCLTMVATLPQDRNPIPADSGLTAVIVSDDAQERKSLRRRLELLGITTTVEFNTRKIDLCLVSGRKYAGFPAIISSLPDSTCIVTLHSKAANTVNKNAFHIQLDYPVSQTKLADIVREIERRNKKHRSHTGKRVLVVDDSAVSVRQLERLLTEHGYIVTRASSGHQAIMELELNQFQLVFMDIQMPELDGVETTRRIRKLDSRTPIIGLTAHATDEEKRQYLEAGMNDVFIKPVKKEHLMSIFEQKETPATLVATAPKPPLAATSPTRPAIFDAELALFHANNRPALVEELMALFLKGLPEDQRAINDSAGNPGQLKRAVHKLHGAVSYCDTPRLARAIESLEIRLKEGHTSQGTDQIMPLLDLLNQEIEALMDWYEGNKGNLVAWLENKIV